MKGFFSESSDKSMTRLLSFMAGATACLLAAVQEVLHAVVIECHEVGGVIMREHTFERDNTVIGILLAFAGATKVSQKYVEFKHRKNERKKNNSIDGDDSVNDNHSDD